jgi:hypothetical protein
VWGYVPPARVSFWQALASYRWQDRVFEQLERDRPAGLRYATFKLEDGVSFVHLVSLETGDGSNPLRELSAFKAFTAGIRDRCEESPAAVTLKEVASYGFFGE